MNTKSILSSLFAILIVSGFEGIPHVKPYEKMKLDHMQDNASQNIFNQEHDRQDRP